MGDIAIKSAKHLCRPSSQAFNFEQWLKDIATDIQINPDFSIVYLNYPLLFISEQYQSYLQQISEEERDRYVRRKLQQYLYSILMERLKPTAAIEPKVALSETRQEEMTNRGDRWYETEFFHQLVQCNHGQGYSEPNWLVTKQVGEYWQVSRDGLTIYIDPKLHLSDPHSKLQVGQTVSIRKPHNLIDRGVYIAVGNAGSVGDGQCSLDRKVLQLYFNTDSATALKLLSCFTKELNILGIPFDFKLAYQEANFQYFDAAILEIMSQDWQRILPIIKEVYLQYQPGFSSTIPFFCRQMASGLGLAEKPFYLSGSEAANLGYRHCGTIAEAIIKMFEDREKTQGKFDNDSYISNYLARKNINLEFLYLNFGSEESYENLF